MNVYTRLFRILVVIALCGSLGGCADNDAKELPPGAFPPNDTPDSTVENGDTKASVSFTRIASTGSMATSLASNKRGDQLFVGLRNGLIMLIHREEQNDIEVPVLQSEPAIDLTDEISTDGERGLFDVLLSADGAHLFVSYTASDGAVTVRSLAINDDGSLTDSDAPIIISIEHPFAGHNGGGMALTAAGDLLLSLGDMDLGAGPNPPSQDPTSPLGGILRIPKTALDDPSLRPLTPNPSDLIATGLRNPWRISRDAETDSLWIGDVGGSQAEEINRIQDSGEPQDIPNFGWPDREGKAPGPFAGASTNTDEPYVEPVHTYPHDESHCAISGGFVYRGSQIPSLYGQYVFGDSCSPEVQVIKQTDTPHKSLDATVLGQVEGAIISFGEDSLGELYILTAEGVVLRLDPASWTVDDVSEEDTPPSAEAPISIEPTDVRCEAADSLTILQDYRTLAPQELESTLQATISRLVELDQQADGELSEDMATLRAALIGLATVAAANDWNAEAPAVDAYIESVTSGEGEWADFPNAVTNIVSNC